MAKRTQLLIVVVIGLVLRLVKLDQSFWLDEASQAQQSIMSVGEIWFHRTNDFQPPLFYLLSHYWMQFSHTEIWLRLLPVTFGVLSIIAIYKLGNEILKEEKIVLFGNTIQPGLIAAFLLAINPYLVYYSQEFRMYSLVVLLSIVAMYLLVKKSRLLFVFNAILLYTHYSTVLLFLAQAVYIVVKEKKFKWFLVQLAGTALLFSPWLPQFFGQLHSGLNIDEYLPGWRSILTVPVLKSLPLILFKFVGGRINLLPKVVYGIYIVFILCVTALATILARKQKTFLRYWFWLPIIASILISFKIPQTQPFRLLFTLPALLLMFTQAVAKFPKFFLTIFIYISLVGNITYYTRPRLQREQWRQAIEFLSARNAVTILKFSDNFAPIAWYKPDLKTIPAVSTFPSNYDSVSNNLAMQTLPNEVFVMDYLMELTDPQNNVSKSLEKLGYQLGNEYNFEGVGIIHQFTIK
jgi:mannosyltransferase